VIADHTIAATFAPNVLTITALGDAHGHIDPGPTVYVPYGGPAYLTMQPDPQYHVLDVQVDGVSVGAASEYEFTNVIADHTIAATFAPNVLTITALGGRPRPHRPGPTVYVPYGGPGVLHDAASRSAVSRARRPSVDGASVGWSGGVPNFTNVIADHTIAATFAPNVLTITALGDAPRPHRPGPPPSTCRTAALAYFTDAARDPQYHVLDDAVDGVSVVRMPDYQFTNVIPTTRSRPLSRSDIGPAGVGSEAPTALVHRDRGSEPPSMGDARFRLGLPARRRSTPPCSTPPAAACSRSRTAR
jgi:hypothetical protein